MGKKLSKKPGRDAAVMSINPHDPPPEPTPGLTAHPPYSAKMSVITASQSDDADDAEPS